MVLVPLRSKKRVSPPKGVFAGQAQAGWSSKSPGRHRVMQELKSLLLLIPGSDESRSDLIDPTMKLKFLLSSSRAATVGWVRRFFNCSTTFNSVSFNRNSGLSVEDLPFRAAIRAAFACLSQAATLGSGFSTPGFMTPFITPQSVCPHKTKCLTSSTPTAYSIVAETPPIACGYRGTMFPITRQMNNSPGLVCVRRQGSIRESAQVTNSTSGRCPRASFSNNSRCFG